jgi:two-component system response regulator AtoC
MLLIDDEEGVRRSLSLLLEDEGWTVVAAADGEQALRAADAQPFDAVVCDVRMPGRDGLEILPDLARLQPDAAIVMMSAYGDVDHALEAVRKGAADYLAKPFQSEELLLTLRKAAERRKLERENRRLRRELDRGQPPGAFVAASGPMRRVWELVERAAEYKTTVLVTGESGAGKEVVARAIHEQSERAAQPFMAVNCGAIPETLIESELFGHARGAFTGAEARRLGLFREAEGGTLLLDEIGELDPGTQVKLLRVLQEEEVRPVGEAKALPVDVRIVAATARPLEDEVASGRFRDDLFYRLNVFRIHVPPLRERREDIPVLADHLLETLSRRMGCEVPAIDDDAMELLRTHAWPGNVRELENALERALILARGDRLGSEAFSLARTASPSAVGGQEETGEDLSIKRRARALEERLIRLALEKTGGNRTQAARILEISPRALQYKIKEYGIDPLNPPAR